MKTWYCWIVQKTVSIRIDEITSLPAAMRRHLSDCADCHRHLRLQRHTIQELQDSASLVQCEVPPFLLARIQSAVRRAVPRTSRPAPILRPLWVGSLTLCVVLAVAAIILVRFPDRRASPASADATADSLTQTAALIQDQWIRAKNSTLLAWGKRPEQPLEREIQSVVRDAKSVATALADDFIPDTVRQAWKRTTSK